MIGQTISARNKVNKAISIPNRAKPQSQTKHTMHQKSPNEFSTQQPIQYQLFTQIT
jgi:hypothetical protein